MKLFFKLKIKRFPAFSLLELIIVVSIIGIITGIFLTNYDTGENQTNLISGTQNLARDFRQAQSNAITGRQYNATTSLGGWGVHINEASTTYIIFADVNGNAIFDTNEANTTYGGRTISLPTGVSFATSSLAGLWDVIYKHGNYPQTDICDHNNATSTAHSFILRLDSNHLATSTVYVNTNGMIDTY